MRNIEYELKGQTRDEVIDKILSRLESKVWVLGLTHIRNMIYDQVGAQILEQVLSSLKEVRY